MNSKTSHFLQRGGNVQTNNQTETNNGHKLNHKMKEDVDTQYHHLQNKGWKLESRKEEKWMPWLLEEQLL